MGDPRRNRNKETFYQKVRTFFLKHDPDRVRLAKKIAVKFRSPKAQQIVMNRLYEVYSNGGPEQLKIMPKTESTPQFAVNSEEE